jgi:hypothetical protein
MGGEVTVYSGLAPVDAAVGGWLDISSKLRPDGICMESPGISIPLMGGMPMPPIMLPISEDIMEEEDVDELEKDEDCIEDEDMLEDPMFIDPIPLIILDIMPSISKLFIPPISGNPPIPPICIIPPGIGPPDDIIVDEEDEDEEDFILEMVDPSSDCVVAARDWLLALSAFFTEVPSSVTKA